MEKLIVSEIMIRAVSEQTVGVGNVLPPFAPDWAFFLDVDGTLLDLAGKPDQVRLRPGLIGILERLHRVTGGAVALISGRTIDDLDRLFAPLQLPAAGQHGLERRDRQGGLHHHQQLDGRLDRTRARLRDFVDAHPGVMLEDKQFSIAVHYRQAPDRETEVTALLQRLMADLQGDFHLQKGKMVCEIKPGGRDKGMAIEEFMIEAPFLHRTPVFIGDDVTDEDGFVLVNRLHGHSIKVGDGETAARWKLADTGDVMDLLNAYITYNASRHQGQQ